MGGKAGTAAAGIPAEHAATYETLYALIGEVAPEAIESEKWGTVAFDLNGSLFALSAKKVVNFYILIPGLLREYSATLGHLPQSSCCLRFAAGEPVPRAALKRVMREAVKRTAR